MLNKTFFISFFLLLLTACGKNPQPVITKKPIPVWVDGVTPRDSVNLYGMGVAHDRDSAIKVALNDMVSQLGTTIESKTEVSQESEGSYYYKSGAKSNIKSHVKKIELKNYVVQKAHRISYKEFAVMLQLSKEQLANDMIISLENDVSKISDEINTLQDANILQQYNKNREIYNKIGQLTSNLEIIKALRPSFKSKEYVELFNNRKNEYLDIKKRIHFVIKNDVKASTFADKITNYLSKSNFRIGNKVTRDSIVINVTLEESKVNDTYVNVVLLRVKINVLNNAQNLANKTLTMKERFIGSMQNVYENASIHFDEDINNLGLEEVIGISLNLD